MREAGRIDQLGQARGNANHRHRRSVWLIVQKPEAEGMPVEPDQDDLDRPAQRLDMLEQLRSR